MIVASFGLYLAKTGHDHETARPEGAPWSPGIGARPVRDGGPPLSPRTAQAHVSHIPEMAGPCSRAEIRRLADASPTCDF